MRRQIDSSERRIFLKRFIPAGLLMCAGAPALVSSARIPAGLYSDQEPHKFQSDSGMSMHEVFNFAFTNGSIPVLKNLAAAYGNANFIEKLKKASSDAVAERTREEARKLEKNDLAAFTAPMKDPGGFLKNVITFVTLENSPTAFEVKVTECLWAKVFREAGAADIGYAVVCFPDFAMAQAFNPGIRLMRGQTLMEGHDRCNHCYIYQG